MCNYTYIVEVSCPCSTQAAKKGAEFLPTLFAQPLIAVGLNFPPEWDGGFHALAANWRQLDAPDPGVFCVGHRLDQLFIFERPQVSIQSRPIDAKQFGECSNRGCLVSEQRGQNGELS